MVAYKQYKIEEKAYKLEKKNQTLTVRERYEISFKELSKALSTIAARGEVSLETALNIKYLKQDAKIYFPDEISNELEDISDLAFKALRLKSQFSELPIGEERSKLIEEEKEIILKLPRWNIEDLYKKHLKLY